MPMQGISIKGMCQKSSTLVSLAQITKGAQRSHTYCVPIKRQIMKSRSDLGAGQFHFLVISASSFGRKITKTPPRIGPWKREKDSKNMKMGQNDQFWKFSAMFSIFGANLGWGISCFSCFQASGSVLCYVAGPQDRKCRQENICNLCIRWSFGQNLREYACQLLHMLFLSSKAERAQALWSLLPPNSPETLQNFKDTQKWLKSDFPGFPSKWLKTGFLGAKSQFWVTFESL